VYRISYTKLFVKQNLGLAVTRNVVPPEALAEEAEKEAPQASLGSRPMPMGVFVRLLLGHLRTV